MEAELNLGDIVEVEVTKVTDFGAFAKINGQNLGLIHISQISDSFVKKVSEHLKVGDKVRAKVIKLGPGKKIDLSLRLQEKAPVQRSQKEKGAGFGSSAMAFKSNSGFKSSDFEDKLKRFLKDSQKSLEDLKKHTEKFHG